MTLAQLEREMSSTEFDLHIALAMLKSDECPNCGVEPRDFMEFEMNEVKCPVCNEKYHKVGKLGQKKGSWKD